MAIVFLALSLALLTGCSVFKGRKDANHAPLITSTPVTTATEDQAYSYGVEVSDLDGADVLSFSLDMSPAGMTIDETTGLIQWTPDNSLVGDSDVMVRVQDLGGLFDTQSFAVTVANTNDSPMITSTAATMAVERQLYGYRVEAADPDAGDALTFSLVTWPSGMSINAITGVIQWTPDESNVGAHQVTVRVEDMGALSDTQSFVTNVENVNGPPMITSTAVTTATEDQAYSYDVEAADLDAGDILTFSLVTSPSGMSINAATGVIQWTPDSSQVGDNAITVRIQDPGGLYDTQSFMVTVSEVVEKYAVIVGISDYKSISDLSYCDEDANAWYAYLISQGYVCLVYGDNTSSYLKYDGLASEYNVRNAIANIVGLADSDDYIVVVISGHGGGDGSGNSYACMWDCDAGELGYDGIYRDVELAADFEDCVAGQLFVFFDTCYSGGMNEVVSSSRIGQVYLSATCGEDGYGWDLGAYQHGAWTQFFLKWGLEGSGHESWDMSNCHGQAYIEYQTYYLTNIGSIDDWTEPDQHDNPEEFDSHPGTAVNL